MRRSLPWAELSRVAAGVRVSTDWERDGPGMREIPLSLTRLVHLQSSGRRSGGESPGGRDGQSRARASRLARQRAACDRQSPLVFSSTGPCLGRGTGGGGGGGSAQREQGGGGGSGGRCGGNGTCTCLPRNRLLCLLAVTATFAEQSLYYVVSPGRMKERERETETEIMRGRERRRGSVLVGSLR